MINKEDLLTYIEQRILFLIELENSFEHNRSIYQGGIIELDELLEFIDEGGFDKEIKEE